MPRSGGRGYATRVRLVLAKVRKAVDSLVADNEESSLEIAIPSPINARDLFSRTLKKVAP